jgi:hypothetical protein
MLWHGRVTIGCELEGLLYNPDGTFFELRRLLKPYHNSRWVVGAGRITTDLGPWQVELISDPCLNGYEVGAKVTQLYNALATMLPDDVRAEFTAYGKRSQISYERLYNNELLSSKHRALLAALSQEKCARRLAPYYEVANLSIASSTHFHFGAVDHNGFQLPLASGPLFPIGLLIRNVLNNTAPWRARTVSMEMSLDGQTERGFTLASFAVPERAPIHDWLTEEAFEWRLRSTGTRVIKRTADYSNADLGWVPDLKTPAEADDPVVQATVWDLAQLSFVHETVEDRALPPIPISNIAYLADTMCCLVQDIISYAQRHIPNNESEAEDLFAFLHASYPDLIPDRPLTRDEWYSYLLCK